MGSLRTASTEDEVVLMERRIAKALYVDLAKGIAHYLAEGPYNTRKYRRVEMNEQDIAGGLVFLDSLVERGFDMERLLPRVARSMEHPCHIGWRVAKGSMRVDGFKHAVLSCPVPCMQDWKEANDG
jgi:hypothetical protein